MARVSVVGIATGYELDGPGIESRWERDSLHLSNTGLRAHPASCTMGTGSLPGIKSGWGLTLTPHPLLVPWSWKGRTIPLLPLWAVRPVQSLSARTMVHFTLPQCLYNGALYLTFSFAATNGGQGKLTYFIYFPWLSVEAAQSNFNVRFVASKRFWQGINEKKMDIENNSES